MELLSSSLLHHYYIFVSFSMLFFSPAQSYSNITLGSTLIAGGISSSWVSTSKDFAFGFQETKPGSYLLAIWFNKIPERTIIWSANRDHPVRKGAKVELTTERSLILTDPSGREIWRAKRQQASSKVVYAAMLDTGNFVLVSQASVVVWQSFDEPTDTLLPTQTMNQGNRLIASFSKKDYRSGRFAFNLGFNGNLALYTTDFPLFNSLNTNYETFEDQGLGYQVVFSQSGVLYLADSRGKVVANILPIQLLQEEVQHYQRVILDYDGVLRHYIYRNQTARSSGWSVKSYTPENICTAVIQQTGSGVCGFNSYCKLADDSKVNCICPPGYALLDPNNDIGGCYQNFPAQSCKPGSQKMKKYGFKVLEDVDWPLSDYEHFENVEKDWCRYVCLSDCFCAVAIFRETGDCWKKKLPLSNGKNDSSVDRTAFIKIRI